MLYHAASAKQETEDPWGIEVEHWGNLLFKHETQDPDWFSRAGLVVVRNSVLLLAYFLVPGLVTAFFLGGGGIKLIGVVLKSR